LVLGTSWLGYELAWYDLVRVRVDWKPYVGDSVSWPFPPPLGHCGAEFGLREIKVDHTDHVVESGEVDPIKQSANYGLSCHI